MQLDFLKLLDGAHACYLLTGPVFVFQSFRFPGRTPGGIACEGNCIAQGHPGKGRLPELQGSRVCQSAGVGTSAHDETELVPRPLDLVASGLHSTPLLPTD